MRQTPFCIFAIIGTIFSLATILYLFPIPKPSFSHLMCHCSAPSTLTPPPRIRTTFQSITALEDLSEEADTNWASLATPKGGFLRVQYNESYVQLWGISMFHQLHCLEMIRMTLQKEMGIKAKGNHHHGGGKGAEHEDDPEHITHCFSYLAQALQCAGDSTIEKPWEAHSRQGYIKVDGVDGLDIVHQCKNTDHMWKAARKSEEKAVETWEWKEGDEIENVFGY
ncbi:hypothetical protein P280DRAFT_553343 [Massarina eburnea CBS 473.64]|uniref:Uncharacterized protein n=1 Tax=Massarina eburnea CBS 473.64 TaxID=1395130 RepID=A0A6A6RN47_9PLEO|nr:hypothetical protein P280DRAFT_553343 [Massarina eburnea CBS 473.64]